MPGLPNRFPVKNAPVAVGKTETETGLHFFGNPVPVSVHRCV